MNIKTLNLAGALAASICAAAATATPQVTSVTMTQPGPDRRVFIDYTFTGADAVITLDVQTNATGGAWASIGGAAVCNAQGEVWKKVTNDGSTHRITWRPDLSWPDHIIADGGARAVVTAWTLDNTPDYMVVDISAAAQQNTEKYYPTVEFLPGGLFANPDYRTTSVVMRKIMAKDVQWTMGSVAESGRVSTREATHKVTLTGNYYIGVFEVTQTQWYQITGYNPSNFTVENSMRPVERVSYTDIRQGLGTSESSASATAGVYPAEPYADSFLGKLRTRTQIDFDLPSEAQWEFAARAGNGEGCWGDGSLIRSSTKDSNLALLGRYQYNGGRIGTNSDTNPAATCGATNGTAIAGSYAPNAWGLYDMHGNVWEWCLDWDADNISALNGAVNTTTSANRVIRGGAWNVSATICRPAYRYNYSAPTYRNGSYGFRLACTVGLQ